MFSEYASKFLAQSQSRLSNFGQTDDADNANRRAADWQSRGTRNYGRSFLSRGLGAANPYQQGGSRFGNLNFASRYSTQDAPLFHSARGDIQEADDEDERDREAADLYALQQSRRVFPTHRLEESSETEGEASRGSLGESQEHEGRTYGDRPRGLGIKSSWNGTRSFYRRAANQEPVAEEAEDLARQSSHESSEGKGKMVDVGLESTIGGEDDDPPADLTTETPIDPDPPAFQQFKSTGGPSRFTLRRGSVNESEMGLLQQSAATTNVLPATEMPSDGEIFKHDPFFAYIYIIAMASLFATFVLVFLHTSATGGKGPIGDTIYTTLRSSFHLLAVDTLVAVIVSLVWLAALRSFVRYLVGLIILAVPVILFSFSLYPLISSYKGPNGGSNLQDEVMRWTAVIPGASAILWLYLVYKGRSALKSSIEILEFSSRILAANSALVLVGMACLALVVLWTWAWLAMFTRVFLGGYFSTSLSRWIISASSWWLGIYFVLMYLWTLSVISGVQRGTTAATVSQWYFHRNVQPAPSSREVVSAALNHSVTTIFGSISLSTLLALVIRLPLLVLPRRLAGIITMFFYSFVPTPITALTNPLTLTYAAIHSQDLATSARGLTQMDFLSPDTPTTTLTPRAFGRGRRNRAPLLPYRLAKLLLHATRFIMATALGFAGWVITARQLRIPDGMGIRGSAYAYVVGLVASFIGWGVLGAMEGILSGIVDAVVICYGSETRMAAGGGGYCMEAAYLFGGRGDERDREAYY
ncbi:uncharacterized protein E0L32_008079 [Thyridium curvatum]|uniref:Protein PNS1 n=1 Tax=Thyridium curvatum TaxID=1093900 RepID=A0A507AMH4_9PEZI|nr:uncharacterized protein E0L32_008079 [Thyridium curvatum]TPX11042.1 hypothetical protein E0L32_008079 [Thyridium curvatum]